MTIVSVRVPPRSRYRPLCVLETAAILDAGEGATGPGAAGDSGAINCPLLLIYPGSQVVYRMVVADLPGWFVYADYYGVVVGRLPFLFHSYRCQACSVVSSFLTVPLTLY